MAGQAHLHEAGVRPAADQELLELVRAVVVHAAVGMAVGEVAVVQREQVIAGGGGGDPHLQVVIGVAQRRWLRSGAKRATGMRTATQAWQCAQCGR